MGPAVEPVHSDASLPSETGVAVVGGGIVGICTAYYLAEQGVPVLLCEKGEIAAEQSSRNWGWVRKQGRDPLELPLSVEALRLWQGMDEAIGAATGFATCGITYLAETDEKLAYYQRWLEHARGLQLDSRILSPDEIGTLLPGGTRRWPGALHTPSDGRAEPQIAGPAIARAARARGAAIVTNCAVRGIDRQAGRVAAIVTERGRVRCDAVVLAGGAWSSLFAGNLGIRLPQLKVLASVLRTAPLEGAPQGSASGPGFAFRLRQDGGYTIAQRSANITEIVPDTLRFFADFLPAYRANRADLRLRLGRRSLAEARTRRSWSLGETTPFEATRILDPAPAPGILDEARQSLAAAFPAFRGMTVTQSWGGLIDATPDAIPVISGVDALPGFFIATGFSGHGFGIAPGAGRLMAQLVTGAPPVVDPAPFRFSRFTERPRPRPYRGDV